MFLAAGLPIYARRAPETSTLYETVRENLETLYGAIDDGALEVKIPKHAKKELESYLECGQLCRGFARLKCGDCKESRIVGFSCKGRGFCPSCCGRRMCATAANLIENVLPEQIALRQWVLTFPFPWRRQLAMDGALLGSLTRIFVETVHGFYAEKGGKSGAVTVVQRTSSDLRLNPHLHTVFLDGAYREEGAELVWEACRQLRTRDVGEVLEKAVRRMVKHLRRREALQGEDDDDVEPEEQLAASAVSGQVPPAGPQWLRGLAALKSSALDFDKPLCAALDGFTLHAATRAGAHDTEGREALLRYVRSPPIAQNRVQPQKDGLVRIVLEKAFSDGTVAVDMDPLSLLCRLATSVPPPRYHIVKYAGVLAPASPWRPRIAPPKPVVEPLPESAEEPAPKRAGSNYRGWAELLRRTFSIDVLKCEACGGRMKLLAMVTDPRSVERYLAKIGETTDVPGRAPSRGPPYWRSTVLRQRAVG